MSTKIQMTSQQQAAEIINQVITDMQCLANYADPIDGPIVTMAVHAADLLAEAFNLLSPQPALETPDGVMPLSRLLNCAIQSINKQCALPYDPTKAFTPFVSVSFPAEFREHSPDGKWLPLGLDKTDGSAPQGWILNEDEGRLIVVYNAFDLLKWLVQGQAGMVRIEVIE